MTNTEKRNDLDARLAALLAAARAIELRVCGTPQHPRPNLTVLRGGLRSFHDDEP
jgi:hypothetical protein